MEDALPLPLQVRWLGKVRYRDALAIQESLFEARPENYLLLMEHLSVFTLGVNGDESNILVEPSEIGAEVIRIKRGGDVTYHGPGQLVGYPILTVPGKRGGGMADTSAYVHSVEQLIIDALTELGLPNCGRIAKYPGVWVDPNGNSPRKIAAIGVRLSRGRSMHGFAINVKPDMSYFEAIVPCGIKEMEVTSLHQEGLNLNLKEVTDVISELAAARWSEGRMDRSDVAWRIRSQDLSPFTRGEGPGKRKLNVGSANYSPTKSESLTATKVQLKRKPEWMKVKAQFGPEYRKIKQTMRANQLVTVCEEAGCPNIYECWKDGTATFMILGDRCTRACGFCLIDTQRPLPPDVDEPQRVADAVKSMGLDYAVVTMVARDDLADGGAQQVANTVAAIRKTNPSTSIEVLISDLKGHPDDLEKVFTSSPDVLNHNVETVPSLQRTVRPSASYARSLAVLCRAKQYGLTTKTSIMLGLGEREEEVHILLKDLSRIGVDIVTLGQYLSPTSNHLPVERWWTPEEFQGFKTYGESLGITHVESSPLTRSSYHAKQSQISALQS
ncbi:MAG TPA: lipoyl synthase [Acidimicrobiaceae bacterium]|nr:lipoyl synthase [Acidimicrobiaceae bacterium]